MDNLFKIRTLTAAVNAIKAPMRRVYNRIFAGYENMQPSDRLAFDVISGSEKLLGNISIFAPATVDDKTNRKTITLAAPRIANKRFVATAELNAYRAFGEAGLEMMKDRIAREQKDMRGKHDRTLEFWAVNALKGKIYDSNMTTVLVDYNVDASHKPTLTLTDLWTDPDSNPIANLRAWKQMIEDDSAAQHRLLGGLLRIRGDGRAVDQSIAWSNCSRSTRAVRWPRTAGSSAWPRWNWMSTTARTWTVPAPASV